MASNKNISTNYISDIIDEIALEGLDGITPDALWKRLSVRQNFCFKIDEKSKNFIWKICIQLNDLKFYELPVKRKSLQYYDYINMQKQHQDANIELNNVYPHFSIKNENGFFGSCEHYSTRKDVTEQVIQMDLQAVEKLFPDTLVIVASQDCRYSALLGNTCPPNLDFSKSWVYYEVLERIGRCRSLGIPTHGKGSLQCVVSDSKSLFHYLKFLYKYKLIKRQPLLGTLLPNPNGSKIYLSRYFGEFLSEHQIIIQTGIEELKTRPNYRLPYEEFYQLFDPEKRASVKKCSKSALFRKYIMVSKLSPYRELFPNATQAEWEKKCKTGEKMIRCFQLLDPNTEVADIFEKEDSDDEEMPSGFLTVETYYKGLPLLHQIYYHVKNSGFQGITVRELSELTGLSGSFIRIMLKRLINEKHCKCFDEISGRSHSKRYMVGENTKNNAVASEIVQILSEKGERSPEKLSNVPESNVDTDLELNSNSASQEGQTSKKTDYQGLEKEAISYRTLRRIGMIIKTIKIHRYRLFSQIYRNILDEEVKEGLNITVDRTTVNRILKKLDKDGLIKIVDFKPTNDNSASSIKLYTEPTFVVDDKIYEILSNINANSKTFDFGKNSEDENIQLESQLSTVLLENLVEMKKMLKEIKIKNEKTILKETKKKESTCSPKFVRLNILHDLMFYLVYEYTGISDRSQEEMIKELSKTCEIDDELKQEMPKIYGTHLSSYLFIPPISRTEESLTGWFLVSELLIRMPLSIFVKVLRINEMTSELLNYLNHPIRKHYLIRDLPLVIRMVLFGRNQWLAVFFNEIKRLSFLGLLQFGVKCSKEPYQTLLYLNRNASLIDTTSSPPGYLHVPSDIQFPVKNYKFTTKGDVKKYWEDMCQICLATNLGDKTDMIGKEVLAERESNKDSLKKVIEPKTIAKAIAEDNGSLPGDHLGAGGIDSVMFSFLRSNWIGPVTNLKDQTKQEPLIKVTLKKLNKDFTKRMHRIRFKNSRLKKHVKNSEAIAPKPLVNEAKSILHKMRRVRQRETRFKRVKKTYYDEMDLEALKLKNTLRVTWSAAEDHHLLICKVAMTYFCPNARGYVRIPWSEVRSNLQKRLVESRNKTQKAIARRIMYMMKNPTTERSVSLCLEELNQIPEIAERFSCKELVKLIKPSAPNLAELQEKLYEKFHSLTDYLKEHFSKDSSFKVQKPEDLLPDTLDDFRNMYEYESKTVGDNLSLKSIRETVIRAILMLSFQSSVSCRTDKTSSAIQLFQIYRQYEDDELQSAIKKLSSDKVITVRKHSGSIFKNGRYLPLTSSPWKLSYSFKFLLKMKYSHNLYPDAFNMINNLLLCTDSEGFGVDLNDCNVPLFVLACMNLASLRTTVPEQIMVLDSGTSMDDATYDKMLKRYCDVLQLSKSDSKLVCSSGQLLTTVENGNKRAADESNAGHDNKRIKLDSDDAKEKAETENVSLREAEARESTGKGAELVGNGSWRFVLYMMREEAKKEMNNFTGNRAQEFFVVNASQVHCSKVQGLEFYAREMDAKVVGVLLKNIMSRFSVPLSLISEDSVYDEFQKKEHGEEDLKLMKDVLSFIYSKKEFGATNGELRLNFKNENLPSIVRYLVEAKIVIKTGILETRYIGQKYSSVWLLSSFRTTRLEREKMKPSELTAVELRDTSSVECSEEDSASAAKKKRKGIIYSEDMKKNDSATPSCSSESNNKVKMIIRPWIRIDGSLNRKVLDRFLGAILGYIMIYPGITIKSVMDKFFPSLLPVWTKDLIEILHTIGCISFKTFIIKKRATLFAEEEVFCTDGFNGLESDDCVVVEAKVDAITTLGLFIGKRTYSVDFLKD